MLIKSNLKKRLLELQKRMNVHNKLGAQALKIWIIDLNDQEDETVKIAEIKAGKVKHQDGSFYSFEDSNLFICKVVISRDNPPALKPPDPRVTSAKLDNLSILKPSESEEDKLKKEISRLQAKKQKLLKQYRKNKNELL